MSSSPPKQKDIWKAKTLFSQPLLNKKGILKIFKIPFLYNILGLIINDFWTYKILEIFTFN